MLFNYYKQEDLHHNQVTLFRIMQAELTPKSLPTLLAGGAGIDSTLVLWCNEDVSSDMAATFKQQAFHNPYADFIFAWINRY